MARYELDPYELPSCAGAGGKGDALFELGLRYCVGRDVALDLVEAHKWFNIASMRGHAEAMRYRAELSREMSKAEVARAQRLAREWLALH